MARSAVVYENLAKARREAYPDFEPAGRIGPYRLHDVLGEGGMGRVYRAEHVGTGAAVALKTVNKMTRRRMLALREETAALRAIEHPGLVRILDQGSHDGVPWYAMELLTGKTLADYNAFLWDANLEITRSGVTRTSSSGELEFSLDAQRREHLAAGPLDALPQSLAPYGRTITPQAAVAGGGLTAALRLYHQLCEPLGHIHARGMVHRDLKPHNVFIRTDDRPVLMDFGLIGYASGAIGREVLDAGNHGFGTVHYVAPERIDGGHVDARADLYALGCMMYETLLGRPPFTGDAGHVLSQHVSASPIPPSEILSGVPAGVERLILALLAKSPRNRIGHASDVAALLGTALWNSPIPSLHSEAVPLFRPQLSGRDDALLALGAALERTLSRRGELVLIGGESGIGKTFLTSELARSAGKRGFRVVTSEATHVSPLPGAAEVAREPSAGPFQALRRLLQTIADTCRELGTNERQRVLGGRAVYLAPYEPSLEPLVEIDPRVRVDTLPGAAGSERILSAFAETLHAYSSQVPLLLIVDDLHWADALTLSLLERLNRSFFDGLPLLLVCTYRTDQTALRLDALRASDACTTLTLGKLGDDAVRKMVGDMLSSTPPDDLVAFLVKESEGNPFFVAEYLRYLVRENYLERLGGHWALAVERTGGQTDYGPIRMPGKLEELLGWRLEALSKDALAVTQAAAVLGRNFDIDVLAQTSGVLEDALLPLLREARERQVIEAVTESEYRFTHDKLREATYAGLALEARRRLHAEAARAIDASLPQADSSLNRARELARHYKLAGELAKALEYFAEAGEEAVRKSALHEGISHLRSALELAQSVGGIDATRRASWERLLGGALHDIGEFEEGSTHLRRALALLGEHPPRQHAAALAGLTALEVVKQVAHRLLPAFSQGSGRTDATLLLERARIHDRLQQAAYYRGDVLPMLFECLRTLNLAEQAPPSPTLTVAYANAHAVAGVLPARGLVGVYEGLARRNMQSAPNAVSEAYFHMLSGVYLTGIGAWARALESLGSGLLLCRRVNFEQRAREITGAVSICQFLSADYEAAKQNAQDMVAQSSKKYTHTYCWGLLSRAQVLLVEGQFDEALKDVERSQPLLDTLARPERIWAASLEAFLRAKVGDRVAADNASRRALEEIARAPTVTHFTLDAVARCAEVRIWLDRNERTSAARRLARRALSNVQKIRRAFPAAEPREKYVLGHWHRSLGDEPAARKHFEASLAISRGLEMRYDESRALLACGSASSEAARRGESLVTELRADVGAAQLL